MGTDIRINQPTETLVTIIEKWICNLLRELKTDKELQMVVCTGNDGSENYWLLNWNIKNDKANIPIATWIGNGMIKPDFTPASWFALAKWLLNKFITGEVTYIYNEGI